MGGNELNKAKKKYRAGASQLSIVEHALCPLDTRNSLLKNQTFESKYHYYDKNGRNEATAKVFCPRGLSASDEFYLWGLLALTLNQPKKQMELLATPHWCLKQLGVVDSASGRGGRQYKSFVEAIRRLAVVKYANDSFYDPTRKEHRCVAFGFLSYSLPANLSSERAWRFAWDPIFFQMVEAIAGSLRFNLATYRNLDPASRRLFLFVSKVFQRTDHIKAIRLEHLAVNLLGFSESLEKHKQKSKVTKCLKNLMAIEVFSDMEVYRTSPGRFFVRMRRGKYFDRKTNSPITLSPKDSPTFESLLAIGFDTKSAARLIGKFPSPLLSEWIDITQAAIEHFGPEHFHKSPMAYLVDSVTKASIGNRTAPDWWHDMRRRESNNEELSAEAQKLFARVRSEVFGTEGEPNVDQPASEGLIRMADVLASRASLE